MNNETIDFYDKESSNYSEKRYPPVTVSYTQYLFKKRLEIFLSMLERINEKLPPHATILEIGCADGIVLNAIERKFPGRFSKLVGIDISSKMIEEATRKNTNPRAIYYVRNSEPVERYDIVVELGVHPFDVAGESLYVYNRLNFPGYFFYDSAGANSLFYFFKLRDKDYAKDYKSYEEYEKLLQGLFFIKQANVYGLFIPKLWGVPFLGRLFQQSFDLILKSFPNLFHEQLYLLEKKREPTFEKK